MIAICYGVSCHHLEYFRGGSALLGSEFKGCWWVLGTGRTAAQPKLGESNACQPSRRIGLRAKVPTQMLTNSFYS